MTDDQTSASFRLWLSPYPLIKRYGVWPATIIIIVSTFLIVSVIVVAMALWSGFPILPGILINIVIHLVLLPQTYQTSRLIQEQEQMRAALYRASITDELTGAYNRRHFITRFGAALAGEGAGRPCALILIDIDHFKQINDTHGHAAGDEVLRQVCTLYRQHTRLDDTFARYGGEEFIFLLWDVTPADARAFAERMRMLTETHRFSYDAQMLSVTVSVGVAAAGPGIGSADQLLSAVDKALYEAKGAGRNRVVCI